MIALNNEFTKIVFIYEPFFPDGVIVLLLYSSPPPKTFKISSFPKEIVKKIVFF